MCRVVAKNPTKSAHGISSGEAFGMSSNGRVSTWTSKEDDVCLDLE